MKIALAQINTKVGDFDGNIEKVQQMVNRACHEGADLIVFPEMTVSGYPPRDLLDSQSFVERNIEALHNLLPSSERMGILIGHIARSDLPTEKSLVNAASLLDGGKIQFTYSKRLLPTYDVFDEARYFVPGKKAGVFKYKGMRLGVTICEDIWSEEVYGDNLPYPINPVEELTKQNIRYLLNLSASPYGWDKELIREEMIRSLANRHRMPIYFCNLVGGNDELVFDGRSTVVNGKGEIVAEAARFEEDLLIVGNPDDQPPFESRIEFDENENIFRALCLGLRDYVRKCGFREVVLGLSGGIDSALTAVIAAQALGADKVVTLTMPSRYTSEQSIEDARKLAKNLGIRTQEISIEPIYQGYLDSLKKVFKGQPPDTTEENIQARIRGNILMAYSNKRGHLVLSTGNKSELSVGYCTLYGDMSGGLAVLSDIPKTLVYRLSEWINREKEIIPHRIISKAPTAELRDNQKDQDILPPYDILDSILKAYIEDHLDRDEIIVKQGFDADVVDRVIHMVIKNEYKRQQMPVGLKVSKKAFGLGRRLPLAKKI